MEYSPSHESATILSRAWEHVNSVPYKVSLRWLFYRLLQDGIYHAKEDYKRLVRLTATARKRLYCGWRPNTLADATRHSRYRSGTVLPNEVRASVIEYLSYLEISLAPWPQQQNYCEIWYEAKAMTEQFEYYTSGVTLRPFGGDPSIPFKYQIAGELTAIASKFECPVTILYFGDLDDKGQQIPDSAYRDISDWTKGSHNICVLRTHTGAGGAIFPT